MFGVPIHPNLRRPVAHNQQNIDSDYEHVSEDEDENVNQEVTE